MIRESEEKGKWKMEKNFNKGNKNYGLASESGPMATTDIELTAATESTSSRTELHRDRPEFSLPRADGGKDAWLVLMSCFILEALVWGKLSTKTPYAPILLSYV